MLGTFDCLSSIVGLKCRSIGTEVLMNAAAAERTTIILGKGNQGMVVHPRLLATPLRQAS